MKVIAQVKVAPIPEHIRTLAEFEEWRTAEDARMKAVILKALAIHLTAGCIDAIIEGLNDLAYTPEECGQIRDALVAELEQPQ